MNKLTTFMAVIAMVIGNSASAQPTNGKGAVAAKRTSSNNFAWGIGLGALVVLGVVVGVTAGVSTSEKTPSFNH